MSQLVQGPQKRIEQVLEAALGSGKLLDALPMGVYCCDADGHLVQYNEHAAELWGCRPQLGDTLYEGAPRLFSLDGEPLPQDQAPMAQVLQTAQAVRNQRIIIERPDASRMTVLVNADPLYDKHGALVGAVNCFRDVTELRLAYQELQRSRDDLEDFFENGAVGLHIVDGDGTILRANKAELALLGYSAEEYVGRRMGWLLMQSGGRDCRPAVAPGQVLWVMTDCAESLCALQPRL